MGHSRPGGTISGSSHVRFSNRPFEVKRFQTIRRCGVDVTHGLVLLFGIGTKAVPSWDSRTRWNNLFRGLAVRPTAVAMSAHSKCGAAPTAFAVDSSRLSRRMGGGSFPPDVLSNLATRKRRAGG
jgi:hypothetical protein